MLTSFGKECKRIRFNNDEVLGDMANRLGVTSSFLSAVMNGKKNIPDTLCIRIKVEYDLDSDEYERLVEAAMMSQMQVKIKMEGRNESDRDLILSFARSIDELSAEDKKKIMTILGR